MTKGKRPTAQPSPWNRRILVLGGLVVVALAVWWVARPSAEESGVAPESVADGTGPQPLAAPGAPTVEAAATLENVPPDSMASAGPDAPSGIDISNDPRRGSADAPVTIVEFSDFQCPHCRTFHMEIFPTLQSFYGDNVRWVFVNKFFADGHQYAEKAAIGGECAARQGKFWEYADYVFAHQEELGDGLVDRAASTARRTSS
jgi:protein-disulfide isomerase